MDLILRFNLQTGETDPIYRFKNQKAGIDSIRAMQKIGDNLIVSRYCDYMVWDSLTKNVHYHYDQMISHIRGFCLLGNGIIVKDGDYGETISIQQWDVFNNRLIINKTLDTRIGRVRCIDRIGPTDQIVVGLCDGTVLIYDPQIDAEPMRLPVPHLEKVTCLKVTASSDIISGSQDSMIKIWRHRDKYMFPSNTLTGHQGSITCLDVLGDHRIVSASDDGTIRIWDSDTGRSDLVINNKSKYGGSDQIWVFPDNQIITKSCGGTHKIWY
jgi:WD40 repeat protein